MAEFKNVLEDRHTTFAWDLDKVPSEELLLDVLKEVYENIPSKNLMFSYQIRLLRNDDDEVRKKIMTICQRNASHTIQEDRGNPQVLAPWLIGFNARWVSDLEKRYETTSKRGELDGFGTEQRRTGGTDKLTQDEAKFLSAGQTQNENIEIGIASAYIMLAMANRGIQTGMCQNICNDFKYAEQVFKVDDDERGMDFRFIMGVGYGKDIDTHHDYFDPRIGQDKKIPFPPAMVEKVYPRPNMQDIIKVVA
jgi:hypothetical protein